MATMLIVLVQYGKRAYTGQLYLKPAKDVGKVI